MVVEDTSDISLLSVGVAEASLMVSRSGGDVLRQNLCRYIIYLWSTLFDNKDGENNNMVFVKYLKPYFKNKRRTLHHVKSF